MRNHLQMYHQREWIHIITVVVVMMAVYLWSMPRTVVLEDDGLFILAAYFNGIAHPPGYPLYTLMGHAMTWLPFGSVAYRVHALSALFGALGCGVLWWVVHKLVTGRIYAYTASLAFGFSQVYWSQAIVAEVYTLNVLLILLLLVLALAYVDTDEEGSIKLLMWMGLLYGLGLSNHWPLLILSTPMLLLLMWPQWKRLMAQIVYGIPFVLLGLLPYAWMVYRSQMGPEISFYGPLESWSDFWFFVSREGYSGSDNSPSAGWWDKWMFCGFILRETLQQLGVVGSFLAMIGFFAQWRLLPRHLVIGLLAGYIGNTFLLIILLGFDYELLHQNIFRVYPLIAYSLVAIWMGLGMRVLLQVGHKMTGRQIESLPVMTSILVIGLILIINIKLNYRAQDDWAEIYAKIILDNVPEYAVIFTDGDLDLTLLGYLNKVQKYRDDVVLYSHKGILFSNRLFTPRKNTAYERAERIDNFLQSTNRPVYYTYGLPHMYGTVNYGLFNRVDRELKRDVVFATPEIVSFIKGLVVRGEPYDPWEKMHYRLLLADYCQLSLMLLEHSLEDNKNTELQEWVDIICNTYHGYLNYMEVLLADENPDVEKISGLIEKAQSLKNQIVMKSEAAKLLYLQGELNLLKGEIDEAINVYKESQRIWPHPDNPAINRMQVISKLEQSRIDR